jgi:uncharacterized protein DUF2695
MICSQGMGDDSHSDLISSITPDVMRCLRRSQFFELLDDLLCPREGSSPRQCSGDYTLSETILTDAGYDPEEVQEIFDVLRSQGGCCDCEILYNVAEPSRLKANYWRSRVHNPRSHSGQ